MKFKVRGRIKPDKSFKTLPEWEEVCLEFLSLQKIGVDVRGGTPTLNPRLLDLLEKHFSYQFYDEVNNHELFTFKTFLNFVEDFVNHRFWGLENEYSRYFPNMNLLRFSYFYSRGDIEPYVLLNEDYTYQMYGSLYNPKELLHYTTEEGFNNIMNLMNNNIEFDISSFTVAERPFFRKESNLVIRFIGNVRAGFRSDVKSFATSSGRRAANMLRLEYPGEKLNNICYELESCDGSIATSLWNEYIATPLEIVDIMENVNDQHGV